MTGNFKFIPSSVYLSLSLLALPSLPWLWLSYQLCAASTWLDSTSVRSIVNCSWNIPLDLTSSALSFSLLPLFTCCLCFISSFGHIRYRGCAFLHATCEVWVWYWLHKNVDSQVRDSAPSPTTLPSPLSPNEKLYFMHCFLRLWMRPSEWIAVHSISIASVWSDNHNADIANAIAMGNCWMKLRQE